MKRKKIIIIGAGFSGHTAAMYLGDKLGKNHDITVVNRSENFVFIPSLVWVGVQRMNVEKVQFPLKPVYDKFHINFVVGRVSEIHPEEKFIITDLSDKDETLRLDYDFLIVATGPKLNYSATEGLGPDAGFSQSICTPPHAVESGKSYLEMVKRMEKGEKIKFVIGTGHGTSTCQGAAFEYISNIHADLLHRKLRDKADIHWLSNEPDLGDFGVNGVTVVQGKHIHDSKEFIGAIFDEFHITHQIKTATQKVDNGRIFWENSEGQTGETAFDFSMLIPQFTGPDIKYIGKDGEDIKSKLCNPGGFILVDGTYGRSYDELVKHAEYWPKTYQSPKYPDIYAAGIAFAPPGPISQPFTNPNGLAISPAPPRTGMVSGIIGRLVALNIVEQVLGTGKVHEESMTEMYAACIASMGDSLLDGSAAVILMYPVVPNKAKYPLTGRDVFVSSMEMGLAGAWMKRLIHTTFMHKFRGRPFWSFIPE